VSYGGLGFEFSDATPVGRLVGPLDYLNQDSPGFALLQQIASDTVTALLSGKMGGIATVQITANTEPVASYVAASPLVAAIWGGHTESAQLFGSVMVSTLVAAERAKKVGLRQYIYTLAPTLVQKIADGMLAGGDPSSCMIAFETSVASWKTLYPAVPAPGGQWCKRELVFTGTGCEVGAQCAAKVDPRTGAVQVIATSAPPPGALTAPPPPSATAPQRAPTHYEINADIEARMAQVCPPGAPKAGYCGESLSQMETAQEMGELSVYLNALSQARLWLAMALNLPTTASDAAIWGALSSRGIQPAEAIDWFASCDAGLDCFRARMNAALGETDTLLRDNRAKTLIGVSVLAACAVAFVTWRRRR